DPVRDAAPGSRAERRQELRRIASDDRWRLELLEAALAVPGASEVHHHRGLRRGPRGGAALLEVNFAHARSKRRGAPGAAPFAFLSMASHHVGCRRSERSAK